MKTTTIAKMAGCLIVALVLAACDRGWKDASAKCTGTSWQTDKVTPAMAKLYQSVCDAGKTANDLRCKDGRLEVQCK
jgi:hypothetical protein